MISNQSWLYGLEIVTFGFGFGLLCCLSGCCHERDPAIEFLERRPRIQITNERVPTANGVAELPADPQKSRLALIDVPSNCAVWRWAGALGDQSYASYHFLIEKHEDAQMVVMISQYGTVYDPCGVAIASELNVDPSAPSVSARLGITNGEWHVWRACEGSNEFGMEKTFTNFWSDASSASSRCVQVVIRGANTDRLSPLIRVADSLRPTKSSF